MVLINKKSFLYFCIITISACTSSPPCEQLMITASLSPIIVDLGYEVVDGANDKEHALIIYMPKEISTKNNSNLHKDTIITKHQSKTISENIYFEYDSYKIPKEGLNTLIDFIKRIDKGKLLHIVIEGHTDSHGSRDYNYNLSVNRAKSIKNFLIKYGVNASSISINGFGELLPIESNRNVNTRAKNRRGVVIQSKIIK